MLEKIFQFFQENDLKINSYHVPKLWYEKVDSTENVQTSFNQYYLEKIGEILIHSKDEDYQKSISNANLDHAGIGGNWSYTSSVYNAFPRFTTAYDHNLSGDLVDYSVNNSIIKKTGTFLKMITLLPYIKKLGCNVLNLMPITAIGKDGKRGDLGSPYAIQNPYKLDENLAETAIPFSAEDQFLALVEACHMLDIRMVLEFVLRTASLDSDWVAEHPDWFYWIKKDAIENYRSPEFNEEQLAKIKRIPSGSKEFIAPAIEYQNLFAPPPKKSQIKLKNGKYVAQTKQGELVVASAFADWPPDDIQPPWDDVTYLRMYHESDLQQNFNYIAYDTIRYYHPDLARPENRNQELWQKLKNIVPYYQNKFGIDGIMLDMGHALPVELMKEVIDEARKIDSDFGFWEENFEILQSSRNIGFNATLGFEWKFKELDAGIRNMLITARKKLPLPFMGTPETHNTPRVFNEKVKLQYWVLNQFLPSCLPFLHAGYELNEKHPVNTGLNFSTKELEEFKNFPLPLFYSGALDWDTENNLVEPMQKIAALRAKNQNWIATGDERTLTIHYPENAFGMVIAFERQDAYQPWKSLLVIFNTNLQKDEKFFLQIHGTYNNTYQEYVTRKMYTFGDHWISTELEAGGILIFELHKLL